MATSLAIQDHAQRLSKNIKQLNGLFLTTALSGQAITKQAQDEYAQKFLNGQPALSEEQLQLGLKKCAQLATDAEALLSDPESDLRRTWVSILEAVAGQLRGVSICTPMCEQQPCRRLTAPNAMGLPCRLGPHHHDSDESRDICRHSTAVLGDLTFATIVWCLAESQVTVQELEINSALLGDVDWSSLPGWERLDLHRLQHLTFIPSDHIRIDASMNERGQVQLHRAPSREARKRAGWALHSVLSKCSRTLQSLHLPGLGGTIWLLENAPEMPALREFMASSGFIAPNLLADWLNNMPSLEYIHLSWVYAYDTEQDQELDDTEQDQELDDTEGSWVPVFDAIGNHSNVAGPEAAGMEVYLDHLFTEEWGCVTYRRTVRRLEDPEDGADEDEDFENDDTVAARELDMLWIGRVAMRYSIPEDSEFGSESG